MPDFTAFDGVTINGASAYRVFTRYGEDGPYTAEPQLRPIIGRTPTRDGIIYAGRSFPFIVDRAGSTADAQWQEDVQEIFTPNKGERVLTATANGVTVTLNVDVTELRRTTHSRFEGVFHAADPYWKSTTTSTDSASPLTQSGNVDALPVITVTPASATMRRVRATITDTSGRGLVNYPYRITFDSTGVSAAAAADYIAFYNGRAIPFYVANLNNAATTMDVRLDIPPSGSSFVDIFYGSSVNNTITAQTLDDGGHELTDATYTNTRWVFHHDQFDRISTRPPATGVWRLGKIGNVIAGTSFGITTLSTTGITFSVKPNSSLANDADAIVLTVGAEAGTTNALDGLTVSTTTAAGSPELLIRYRKAGEGYWRAATGAYDLDNAVEIAIGIQPTTTADDGTVSITEDSGDRPWRLLLTATPTLSVSAAVDARTISGAVTNSTTGDSITFTDVYLDNTTLIVDCAAKRVYPSSGPLYGIVVPNNRADWFRLAPGSNTWTDLGLSSSFSWANRYAL
jgi:hypothetical protein